MSNDKANHPAHYGGENNEHEVIKCLSAWGLEKDALIWNVVKYCSRAGKKPGEELTDDLKKALFYLKWKLNGGRRQSEDTLDRIQVECALWQAKNFPASREKPVHPLLGMVEELGELAHAFLKCEQGIRGTPAEHTAAKKDAVGDMLIFLMDFCTQNGWKVSDVLNETWEGVKTRDWTKNKTDGKTH